jgi:hypothetical protein
MKWIFLIIYSLFLSNTAMASNKIVNETNKEMLCIAKYPSVYGEKIVDGNKRRVKIKSREEQIKIIQPRQSFTKKRKGTLNCYNDLSNVQSSEDNNISKSNSRTLKSFIDFQNIYDLTYYEGKDRSYIAHHLGIPQSCAKIQDGQYCNQSFGADIVYDRNEKVKRLIFYRNTVYDGLHPLPFTPESILHLRCNVVPLGLWITKKYKKLFNKKPIIHTQNLIMWENLSKHIQRVIMIPLNGYYELSRTRIKNGQNLFSIGGEYTDKAYDYVRAIEVQYR